MSRSTAAVLTFFSLICIAFSAPVAHAQYRASLRGTVTDTQGAVVPGATVTLLDVETNKTLVSISDDNGIYNFNALRPAPYKLTIERDGFTKKILEHIVIIPEQPNALDIQLQVGQVQQSITVSDTTQTLDTDTATLSGTINSNQVQHMPSFGRDVFQLIQLAPGVFGDGAQAGGGGGENLPGTQGPGATGGNAGIFATENGPQALAHGGQYENNAITVDGVSTTSAVWGGTTIITPSEDSVQDVKVVSNGYDAEYGRFSGAQIQVISKTGSNAIHGSAFFTAHRPGLSAYQPYNGPNAVQRDDDFFDQFGGNITGPIWKDKLFASFTYETVRSPAAQANHTSAWYETPSFEASAPAGSIASTYLNFPGAAVNGTISPIGNDCVSAGLVEGTTCVTIPGQGIDIGSPLTTPLGSQDLGWTDPIHPGLGNGFDGVADLANYETVSNTNFSKAQYAGRLDAPKITEKDSLAFSIYWVPQSTTFLNGPSRDYNFFHHSQINESYTLIWNRSISTTFLNEARFNGAGWHWNEVASNPQSPVGLPSDSIGEIGTITPESFGPSVGSILNQWTYTFKDVATKIIGRHSIKFGGDLTRLFYLNECAGCGVPSYSFFNMWDFLNDAPHSESSGFNPLTGAPTTQRQDDRTNIWGFFAQDDFKVRRNLTLNLGLRWSYFGPLYAKQGNMFHAIPGQGADFLTGLTVSRGNSWNAQKNNFGPQLGFAWSPGRFNDKLVVRGGYGLSYNQEEIAISANINANPGLITFPTFSMSTPSSPNPGIIYATSADVHNLNAYPANPNAVVSFGPNGLPTTGQVGVGIFPPNLPTQRTHHYSLDTEYDFGHNLIASLGYQGSLSRDLYFHQNPNATPAALGYQLNPQIGGGDYWAVNGYGNYNALLAELKHNFSHQFMADAQFTWAKSLDTSSAPYSEQDYPYSPSLNYGRSDYDVNKAFKIFGMWQPVFFHGNNRWMEKIAGGWSFSGIFNLHSGFPWTPVVSVLNGSLYCGTCGYGSLLPTAYLGGAGTSTGNDAFKSPTSSNYPLAATLGNASAYFLSPSPCSPSVTTNCYTPFSGTDFGSALPPSPGVQRNSLKGPGYRDVDFTIAKAFGLPNMRGLGEGAKFEFRMDIFNIFNNLNFNPNNMVTNVNSPNFGTDTNALAGRVITLSARFSF